MVLMLTEHTYESLLLDMWPRPAAIVDFGIDSTDHLGALQHAVKHDGVTVEQLNDALGSGKKLNALIKADNPYGHVKFATSYDFMNDEEDEKE